MMKTRMVIRLEQHNERDKYDIKSNSAYGEDIVFTYDDVSDFNIHELFNAFEKVAKILGYSDRVIMAGGCELAFSELRDPKVMKNVAKEYDLTLNEF